MEISVAKGEIIKGKPVADEMSENLIKEVNEFEEENIKDESLAEDSKQKRKSKSKSKSRR